MRDIDYAGSCEFEVGRHLPPVNFIAYFNLRRKGFAPDLITLISPRNRKMDDSLKAPGKSIAWVLNPKALPAFIGNSKKQLNTEEISMISFHLSRHVRIFVEVS